MFIEFESIKYKNFLSTGNQFVEISLNKDGNTLLWGVNASGKCLNRETEINISINNSEVEAKFMEYISEKKIRNSR